MAIEKEKEDLRQSISQSLRVYAQYAHVGYEIVAAVLLSLGIGYGLDALLDWYPAFTVSFAVVGVILGVVTSIRSFNRLSSNNKATTENENFHQ